MRYLTRGLFLGGLILLEVVMYHQVVEIRDADNPDNTKLLVLFAAILFVAVVIGTIIAVAVIPSIGETIGNFFFNPNQQIEKNPHFDALAKIAQGDYEGAIADYKKNLAEDPHDMHALSEIVHIYCDKLHDHDAAEKFLEESLQQEWPPEQGAFLASRLVDVYWNHKHDATRARHVLLQIAETMPDTRHAANAVHRLHEIDRALADQAAGIIHRPVPSALSSPESATDAPGEAEASAPGEVEAEG